MVFATPDWDMAVFELLNQDWRNGVLDWAMPLISSPVVLWVLGAVLFALVIRKQPKRQIARLLLVVAALGLADAGTSVLKDTFERVRPLNSLSGAHYHEDGQWQVRPPGYVNEDPAATSYPSAHASNSMAAAFMAALIWSASRRFIWVLPLVVGYSRIYLAKHFPTDVLGGWMFGAVVAGVLFLLANRLDRRRRVFGLEW